jgi:acyl-CoA reductase-like NAD-dependent aldehyde dehydrogenase
MLCYRVSEGHLSIRVSSLIRMCGASIADISRKGQKCSALSRLYVSSSVWKGGFKDQLLEEIAKIKIGAPQDFGNFMGPVMFVV